MMTSARSNRPPFIAFCVLLSSWTAHALAPPHPSWTDYETVHQMRRRLNQTYDYNPVYLTHEHCRYVNESVCQKWDEEHGQNIKARKLQVVAGLDTVKALSLLVYYPEAAGDLATLPQVDFFNTLFNGQGTSALNPVGSVKEFYTYNSLTTFDVTFEFQEWQQAAQAEAVYAGGASGRLPPSEMSQLFIPILERMDAAGFDFSPFDANGDGIIDHTVVVTSGYPAELGPSVDGCAPDPIDRVWSQGVYSTNGLWVSADGRYTLGGFMLGSAWTFPLCGTPTSMNVMTHEFMHESANLVDLYDFDMDEEYAIAGVGNFDIMCFTYGWNSQAGYPGYLSPYSKNIAGWLEYIEITENGFYVIQPSELSGQVYVISSPFPAGEYILIENRQAMKWDGDWPATGIVIWKVDEAAPLQEFRNWPTKGDGTWPAQHYRVAVLQADGLYQIESDPSNNGDAGDFWVKGKTLGPGPNTWPNTDSYQGTQFQTGISITVTSDSSYIMQFQVSGF